MNTKDVKTLAERVAALGHELYPAYYVYASGVVNKEKNADNSPIVGVIVSINHDANASVGQRAKMIVLNQVRKAWANREIELNITDENNGQTNTTAVLNLAEKLAIDVPAFKHCAEFCCEGINAGEAYMPAKCELLSAASNANVVNAALEAIGAPRFRGIYVSSSEYNKERAYQVKIEAAQTQVYAKTYGGDYVRAFVSL
ncbi:MAG: hypothetical protein IJX20_04125 [Alphaproteobacteria bacterium]|nr:hypothetical protein [Alphaproteobacteria bacterium]